MSLPSRLLTLLLAITPFAATAANGQDSHAKLRAGLIGRWDLKVSGEAGAYPSWLEISKSGHDTLVGSYVGQFGSARPIAKVETTEDGFKFTVPPQWERRKTDVDFAGRLEGDQLRGETTDDQGKTVSWIGRRAPTLDKELEPNWGKPIDLLADKTLAQWKSRSPNGKHGWQVDESVLTNAKPGQDLISKETFRDFKLAAEFRYPKGSNSGLYLRGRYEVQIEDNFGDAPDSHKIGGVYGFLTPSFNAAKAAGEWQTIDITLIGRRVTVVLNGRRILDQQLIPGITGGALNSDEGEPGPLMIQGDHGPVEFRKLVITPAE